MLQAIREKAQGWIAWAIVVLITIPFALWGIQEYLGVGGEKEVAVVDGDEITQRMLDDRTRDVREDMRRSLGENYSADMIDDAALKARVLDGMIEQRVLANAAAAWNLRTSDAQARAFISSIPGFQRNGQFDQTTYDAAVRNQGMSRAGFEQRVRQDMLLNQLRRGVRDSVFVTTADLAARARLHDQKRTLSFVRVPAANYLAQVTVGEDELRRYYDANLDRYRTPERVKLEYVLLDAAGLGQHAEVDEARLRQYFSDHKGEFVVPEQRAMRHILITVAPDADEAAVESARTQAQEIADTLRGGASFAELAKEKSADPGSAANGGDLGWVEQGVMVPEFEAAAFALAKDQISDPVKTQFGFHIIQVTDVRGGSAAGFDELRDKVEQALRKSEGESMYFDYAERLAESAYENSSSLTPAAETLGLRVESTDWITRNGALPDGLGSPKVLAAAFADDVLQEGHNSELIEIGSQKAVVLRVAEHEPAGVKGFDENREAIEQDYRTEKASEAAAAEGRQVLADLRAGKTTLEQLASEHGWELKPPFEVGREQADAPAEVRVEAFDLAPPGDGASAYAGVVSAEGDFIVLAVSKVEYGTLEALSETERSLFTRKSTSESAGAQMRYLTQNLRERASIELKAVTE